MHYLTALCLNVMLQWIPDEGITVFSYVLHAHLLGAAIQIDWYRDGKHIGIFANDDTYDFNFQETRHFETNKKVLPVSCNIYEKNLKIFMIKIFRISTWLKSFFVLHLTYTCI